jgi:hypothetical protein
MSACVPALRAVHPAAGTCIDFVFRHAFCQIAMRAWIAVDQAINAHQHLGLPAWSFRPSIQSRHSSFFSMRNEQI